jgi:type IV secretory pathway VirB10-like protein
MAERLNNISKLFKNSRTRAILIVTIGLIIFGILVGIANLKKRVSTPTKVALETTPSIESIPGGFEKPETAEYVKLQREQNIKTAEEARKTGTSAVPTIVSSSTITGGWQGGRFSSLNQPPQEGLPNNYLLRVPADSEGTPIYNAQGLMTGLAYGKGGDRVCVMGCTAMGTVSPDGLIRDNKGNVIGKVAASALGTPVYDPKGDLVGYAGTDGKVRDLKGNVVGSIDPDGVFKDNAGKRGGAALGEPVYDNAGHLIGYATPNGLVRGLNGNVLGRVGPDGIARDANNRPIGRKGSPLSAVATPSGTPVYDTKGNLVGYAAPNGVVRSPTGKVVGNLAADGTLRDANGKIIGSARAPAIPARTTTPTITDTLTPSAIASTPAEQLEAARRHQQEQQAAQQTAQQTQQDQQKLTGDMTSQQGLLFAAWANTTTQQFVEGEKTKEEIEDGHGGFGGPGVNIVEHNRDMPPHGRFIGDHRRGGHDWIGNEHGKCEPAAIKAGTVLFAVLNTSVNSDEPGPIMATIVGNRLKGGKLLGTLVNQGQKVMLTFNVLTLPGESTSISINAVAIDPCTARTALSSDTDNHYLLRYGSMFAASFMQGYGQVIQQAGAVVTSNGLNTVTALPSLSPKQEALAALGTVGQTWGEAIRPLFNKPPTVRVYACTGLGILFLADLDSIHCM